MLKSQLDSAQSKLNLLMGQDLDLGSMVDVMKSHSDLYIDVVESVYCVMNASVGARRAAHA